jgi:hypothetical protein
MLSHIYFLISEHKEVDLSVMSQHFKNQVCLYYLSLFCHRFYPFLSSPRGYTLGQMMPATVLLNYKDGVYAIDSRTTEWEDPDKNILTWLVCRTR